MSPTISIIGIGEIGKTLIRYAEARVHAITYLDDPYEETIDRMVLKDTIHKDRDNLLSQFSVSKILDSDIIFIVSEMKYAMGSIYPRQLVNVLRYHFLGSGKQIPKIIYYGIVPEKSSSSICRRNVSDCFEDIAKLCIPYMLVDLDKFPSPEDLYGIAKYITLDILAISNMWNAGNILNGIDAGGYLSRYSLCLNEEKYLDQFSNVFATAYSVTPDPAGVVNAILIKSAASPTINAALSHIVFAWLGGFFGTITCNSHMIYENLYVDIGLIDIVLLTSDPEHRFIESHKDNETSSQNEVSEDNHLPSHLKIGKCLEDPN